MKSNVFRTFFVPLCSKKQLIIARKSQLKERIERINLGISVLQESSASKRLKKVRRKILKKKKWRARKEIFQIKLKLFWRRLKVF